MRYVIWGLVLALTLTIGIVGGTVDTGPSFEPNGHQLAIGPHFEPQGFSAA